MRTLGPEVDVAGEVARLRRSGRAVYVVRGGRDQASALAAFARDLRLPRWFGLNLDALVDALREVDGAGRNVDIVWDDTRAIARYDPHGYAAIRSVLADVEAERPDLRVTVVRR